MGAGTQQVLQNVLFKCSVPAVLLKTAAQKAHQVKTAINLKPLPTIAPQDEFAYYQFRDMKLKGRHFSGGISHHLGPRSTGNFLARKR